MQRDAVSIEHLNVYYGELHALRDVSLVVPEQEVVALIGPSGCGKSVLLQVLNRTLSDAGFASGSVRIHGEEILHESYDVYRLRRRVALVTARPQVFPMSIYENVTFGPRIERRYSRSELNEKVERALSDVQLWQEVKDRLHRAAPLLSAGQQQRLCIARALALNPEVLLMDEPTSTMDPIAGGRIEQVIQQLKPNISILLVTHAVQQASRVSDCTAFFHLGQLIEYGRTEDVFTQPQDQRTADYISGRFVK